MFFDFFIIRFFLIVSNNQNPQGQLLDEHTGKPPSADWVL